MMIRPIALAAAVMLAAPATAQQSATPQENLDCAVWAAYQVGLTQDDETRSGLSIAVAWFIGQYEGQTGTLIDSAMIARTQELDEAAIEQLTEPCIGRFSLFADRLGELAAKLGGQAE